MACWRGGCAALVLLLAGCGDSTRWRSDPPVERPPVPVPDREKEFTDLPVPRDFVRDARSWSREHGSFRMCSLVYTGALDPYRTEEFMRQQMEIAGWRLQDKALDNDEKILNFTKRNDRCRVTVTRIASERRTRLAITLDPMGTESTAPPARPAE